MVIQSLYRIISFIWKHPLASQNRPLAFKRFFAWQIGQLLNQHPVVYPLIEDSVLLVEKSMEGATGNIYTGLLEFSDMAFVLHVLKNGELLVDVGANIGVYTILAARNTGANVIAVEPIPSTFERLRKNVQLNNVTELVELFPVGAGSEDGMLNFTCCHDSINHVLPDSKLDGTKYVHVRVKTLDEICEGKHPVILKLDVEGFEWPALQGAKRVLGSDDLKAIIIELNGCGNYFGYSDDNIHEMLMSYGFKPYNYNPFKRVLSELKGYNKHNTLYLRDLHWATSRVTSSKKYHMLGRLV